MQPGLRIPLTANPQLFCEAVQLGRRVIWLHTYGERRPPSKLEEVQANHWLAEYTTDLIDLLNVLGLLVELEPPQADLLQRVCAGPLLSITELNEAKALELPAQRLPKKTGKGEQSLFE